MRTLETLVCGLATIAIACGGGAKPADTASDSKTAAPAGPVSEADVETACAEIAKNDAACSTQGGAEEKARGQCTRGVACMRDFMRPDAIRPFLDCSRASACDHDKCMEATAAKLQPSPALGTFLAKCEKSCGGKVECKQLGSPMLSDETWPAVTKCFDENADCAAAGACAGMQMLGVVGKGMQCIQQAAKEPGATASASGSSLGSAGDDAPLATEPMERAADIDKKHIAAAPLGAAASTYGYKSAAKGTLPQPSKPIANLPTAQSIVFGFLDKKVAYVRAEMSTGDCNALSSQLEKELGTPRTRRMPKGKEDRGWYGKKSQIVLHLDGVATGICLLELASPKQAW